MIKSHSDRKEDGKKVSGDTSLVGRKRRRGEEGVSERGEERERERGREGVGKTGTRRC